MSNQVLNRRRLLKVLRDIEEYKANSSRAYVVCTWCNKVMDTMIGEGTSPGCCPECEEEANA